MADSRINLYHNLSAMLKAGMPIVRAIENVHKRGRFGRVFQKVQADVARGMSLTDIVEQNRGDFQPIDRILISVGEQTGQVAEMLEALSQWYEFRQRVSRMAMAGMMLPAFYVHAAAFLLPVIPFALGGFDVNVYFKGMLGILALFYVPLLTIFGIVYFTPKQGPLRLVLDTVVLCIPLVGKAVRELSLSRYCKTFSIAYKAGVPIVECAKLATESAVNAVMRRRLSGAYEMARVGEEMSTGFSRSLGSEFISIWQIGEESGELDESAARLGEMHAENAERTFRLVAKLFPFLIYLVIIGLLGFAVIMFYQRIYGSLSL